MSTTSPGGYRSHLPNITGDDPADGETVQWDATAKAWKSVTPSGGGGASTPPGQAAHYIGTWDVAVAYAAGECVRQWDGAEFKLHQAEKVTTGDDPTSVVASWAEVTTPIVMWGTEDPNLTDAVNAHGGGIVAPFGSCYIWLGSGLDAVPGVLMFSDFEDSTVQGIGYWDAGRYAQIDTALDFFTSYVERVNTRKGAGSGDAFSAFGTFRQDSGSGNAVNTHAAKRQGSGTGNADVTSRADVTDTAVGTAFAGAKAIHHASGEAHVFPTATATEAFNDVKGSFDFIEQTDAAVPAASHGRVYMRDNGSGKMQFVARFPSGAVQVIATEP